MNIRISTYNCCSLRKNIGVIRSIVDKKFDLFFLQETFITEDRLGDIAYIDDNYESVGSATVCSEKSLKSYRGRCEGGLICIWRRDIHYKVKVLLLEANVITIEFLIGCNVLFLLNVYIKSDIWEDRTLEMYLETLDKLEDILSSRIFDSVYSEGS